MKKPVLMQKSNDDLSVNIMNLDKNINYYSDEYKIISAINCITLLLKT